MRKRLPVTSAHATDGRSFLKLLSNNSLKIYPALVASLGAADFRARRAGDLTLSCRSHDWSAGARLSPTSPGADGSAHRGITIKFPDELLFGDEFERPPSVLDWENARGLPTPLTKRQSPAKQLCRDRPPDRQLTNEHETTYDYETSIGRSLRPLFRCQRRFWARRDDLRDQRRRQ